MSSGIQVPGKSKKRVPVDPLLVRPPQASDVAPLPGGEPHAADYDDEVPSQRRLRWMTQALVVPFFVGGLWSLSFLLAYSIGLFRCPGAAGTMPPYLGCLISLAALAPLLWFAARGKVGLRRRWLNAILIAAMFSLGASYGWRVSGEPSSCTAVR